MVIYGGFLSSGERFSLTQLAAILLDALAVSSVSKTLMVAITPVSYI